MEVPANGGVSVPGNPTSMFLREAGGELRVQLGGSSVTMVKGDWIADDRGEGLGDIRINNDTGALQNVTVVLGHRLRYGRRNVTGSVSLERPTGLNTIADVSVPATSQQQLLTANSGRTEAHIHNTDGSQELRIGDANTAAGQGAVLAPKQTAVIPGEGAIYAYNPGGSAVNVAITEVTA
jgi:hypothetical protein